VRTSVDSKGFADARHREFVKEYGIREGQFEIEFKCICEKVRRKTESAVGKSLDMVDNTDHVFYRETGKNSPGLRVSGTFIVAYIFELIDLIMIESPAPIFREANTSHKVTI
jgi:hypothetical protein